MTQSRNDGRNATPRNAIDEEKVQIRRSCSYIVAREASDLMSKSPLNRGPAMKKIAERLGRLAQCPVRHCLLRVRRGLVARS